MTVIETRARVDADGNVTIPVGTSSAGVEVLVTVVPAEPSPAVAEDWAAFVKRTQGVIDDSTFVRPEQGTFEVRDPLE